MFHFLENRIKFWCLLESNLGYTEKYRHFFFFFLSELFQFCLSDKERKSQFLLLNKLTNVINIFFLFPFYLFCLKFLFEISNFLFLKISFFSLFSLAFFRRFLRLQRRSYLFSPRIPFVPFFRRKWQILKAFSWLKFSFNWIRINFNKTKVLMSNISFVCRCLFKVKNFCKKKIKYTNLKLIISNLMILFMFTQQLWHSALSHHFYICIFEYFSILKSEWILLISQ